MGRAGVLFPPEDLKAVIFDCDGVMFDSTLANAKFYNRILKRFGRQEMTPAQQSYAQMHTVDEAMAYLFPGGTLLAAAEEFRREMSYLPFIKYMTMAPNLRRFLKQLRSRYHTAVATNRMDTMQRVLIEHDLQGWFDLVITALDVPFPKPHPGQLVAILTHFNIGKDQAIFIGDSELDAMAAESAGIPFVAYNNPHLAAGLHITDFKDLEAILFPVDGC